jgi:hypothetical protein
LQLFVEHHRELAALRNQRATQVAEQFKNYAQV